MFLSVFDLFKIGIGPSSSHTVGPMVAMNMFIDHLERSADISMTKRIVITLYGSLAFTGKGHGTDRALVLGLLGEKPDKIDPADVHQLVKDVIQNHALRLGGKIDINFDFEKDIFFDFEAPLPEHTNGLVIAAYDDKGDVLANETYFSIGGGFVVTKANFCLLYTSPSPRD